MREKMREKERRESERKERERQKVVHSHLRKRCVPRDA